MFGHVSNFFFVLSSMSGSDSSTTNYPGKIPSGPDLPSDFVNEKVKKDELES